MCGIANKSVWVVACALLTGAPPMHARLATPAWDTAVQWTAHADAGCTLILSALPTVPYLSESVLDPGIFRIRLSGNDRSDGVCYATRAPASGASVKSLIFLK